ncbi:FAD-dependent monooxygenase [Cognatishimia sp. WU-CL00825]|uniref:FAD-dependent monooxygenase n=1 Tax=Cognatishimia sp. WU-CL00825 TaxID=3127658 RepID=UPI003108D347
MALLGMNIAVLGGGIGGLTVALALAQRGAQVTVLEQAEAINEVGAGIQVGPNGICVMRALGLEQALAASCVKAKAVELRDYKRGDLVTKLDLTQLGPDQPYYFVHRADLINLLAENCRAAGVSIRLLQKAVDLVPGARPEVQLVQGANVKADLVVCADGLHSVGRKVLNGASAPFFTGQVAWRATVPNHFGHQAVAQVHMGPKRHVVSYPLRGGELVNLVAVQERGEWAEEGWAFQDDPHNLRRVFSDFGGDVPGLLTATTEVGLWGLFRHPVAKRWFGENVALLGDAAHPTLPFMAQGAVMAMEDAWVLADSLATCEDNAAALAMYQGRRFARVTKIVETANGNAKKYHLSNPILRKAAHGAMRALGTAAPAKMLGQFDWIYRHDVTKSA